MKGAARAIARGAAVAALYAALTLALAPISFGQVQLRAAEALMVLPLFTADAALGLFVGCAIANALGVAMGVTMALDVAVGSLATLIAALLTRRLRKRPFYVSMLPPVLVNGVLVGWELSALYGLPLLLTMAYVAFGEALACCALGWPLSRAMRKFPQKLLN